MLKKLTLVSILALSITSLAQALEVSNFEKGKNFDECMNNCRYHHRVKMGLSRGAGKGECWNICSQEHLATQTEITEDDSKPEIEEMAIFGSEID